MDDPSSNIRETNLADNSARFQALLDSSSVAIVVLSATGKIIDLNQAMCRFTGYSAEELKQLNPQEISFPDDQEKTKNLISLLLRGEKTSIRTEKRYIKKDGSIVWGDISAHALCNDDGVVTELIATIVDITERIANEETLRQREQLLQHHIENAPIGAMIWDENFRCMSWNAAAERIFGYTKDQAIGRTGLELVVPESIRPLVSNVFASLLSETGGNHSLNENITRDGRTILCEWFNTSLRDQNGKIMGVASLAYDTTKQKESEEKFRRFYEIMPDVFMITSLDTGVCVDVNEGFCRVTGYSRDDVIGNITTELGLWDNDADRLKLVSGLKENGIVNNLSAYFRRKDRSIWPGMMSACMIQLEGRPHVLSSTKDVSQIHNSELKAIKANRAKSEFLSSMSHELRTPMNAILGFAQLLDFNPNEPLSENQKASVGQILKGGAHLLELIEQVLELSKIEAGKFSLNVENVSARNIIDESLSLIRARADKDGIEIIDSTAGQEIPVLRADRTRMIQVLVNLLSNAVKYNRENGSVTMSCQEMPKQMLRISITDTGWGIPVEKHGDLFKPFERLGREVGGIEGTGIGLSITRQIIELLGGRAGFESQEGNGSTFWVEVPISNNPANAKTNTIVTKNTERGGQRENIAGTVHTVLYIEDSPDNVRLMETIIGLVENTKLLTAYNAELGFDLAAREKPDLILMDINLPGMNGLEALKQFQTIYNTQDIPVIAITAAAMPKEVEAGKRAGFKDYITKPINVPEFTRIIEATIHNSKASV